MLRYSKAGAARFMAESWGPSLDDPELPASIGAAACARLRDELALLDGAGEAFDLEAFRAGALTPVYFGSALQNFGVEMFLRALARLAPSPQPRQSSRGWIDPYSQDFSAFVFKIQANMDPRHRDRMAFLRICSGRFERDMRVHHARLDRSIQMTRSHRLFAGERESLDEAFPGDVIGVVNPGLFVIGDTVTTGEPVALPPIPSFPPETFGMLRNRDVSKNKQFRKGVQQLQEEGVVQVLQTADGGAREPILAAVGRLQFDVVEARLLQEYGVKASVQPLGYTCAYRLELGPGDE